MLNFKSKPQQNTTQSDANRLGVKAMSLADNRIQSVVQQKLMPHISPQKDNERPIQKKANNTGLPDQLKSGIENLSGYSMSDVKVHYNSAKPAQLNAHAYAQGTDIHIASGQEKHLPHEAWHVVQQKQGRVRPTTQLKGKVNVNDDKALEKEADVMGQKALQLFTKMCNPLIIRPQSGTIIQAKFKILTEEQIIAITEEAKRNDENLDAEYLQGLYIKAADAASLDPPLFFKVAKIPDSYFNGPPANLKPRVTLFARANAKGLAEAREEELKGEIEVRNRLNVLQVLATETDYWNQNEGGPIKLSVIKRNATAILGEAGGKKAESDTLAHVLVGGIDQGEGKGYGSIEFRFKKAEGSLFLFKKYINQKKFLEKKHPELNIISQTMEQIHTLGQIYFQARLPYSDERVSNDYLFVEKSLLDAFARAVNEFKAGELVTQHPAKGAVANPSASAKPLPPAPIALPKQRNKRFYYGSARGSRNAGQKAVMGNFSAHDYVARFSPVEANAYPWEWLHLQGSRLGGPNRPENLVAGTAEANTQMIPYERSIFELSLIATLLKPVDVTWTATVRKDADGNNTQIGKTIEIKIAFPKGEPVESQHVNPKRIAALFPVKFEASEGAVFTKRDRDLLENIKQE